MTGASQQFRSFEPVEFFCRQVVGLRDESRFSFFDIFGNSGVVGGVALARCVRFAFYVRFPLRERVRIRFFCEFEPFLLAAIFWQALLSFYYLLFIPAGVF